MRAHTCFTCLTFTDWSAFGGLGWLLGRFVCFAFAFFLFTDQPVRSSYQPMTILAYLHDCHCRYDERSIVQKKKPAKKVWLPGSRDRWRSELLGELGNDQVDV